MAAFRVRVTRLVGMAYRDFVRVLITMPGFVAAALAIAAGCGLVEFFVAANLQEVPWVGASLSLAISVLESFLFTPILIAVHRLIILDEVTPRYVIDPNDRRLLRFFVWSLAVTAFTSVPALLEGVVPGTVPLGFRLALGLAILIIVISVT